MSYKSIKWENTIRPCAVGYWVKVDPNERNLWVTSMFWRKTLNTAILKREVLGSIQQQRSLALKMKGETDGNIRVLP